MPEEGFKWSAFTKPFFYDIWISILIILMILSLAWVISYKFLPNNERNQTFVYAMFISFSLICQKGKKSYFCKSCSSYTIFLTNL